MARPPKNAEGPSATERMEHAFWTCLSEMPFDTITVRDIVERADVNRNSYYYHYESMMDLAQAGVQNSVVLEFAHALLENKAQGTHFAEGSEGEDAQTKLARLRLLAGPNGSPQLLAIVKSTIVGEWLSMYGLEESDLSEDARMVVDFVFGGISSLWASEDFKSVVDMLSAIARSKLITHNIEVLRQELSKCAKKAKAAKTQAAQVEAEDAQMQISLF